jgi:hypothetical protein
MLGDYATIDSAGIIDVEMGIVIRCKRPQCSHAQIYWKRDVVYSRTQDEMVPLGRQQR